jgi:hypothetical protein
MKPMEEDVSPKESKDDVEVRYLQVMTESKLQVREAKNKYLPKMLRLAWVWTVAVYVLLLLQGFHLFGFSLSDAILVTVLGGTTATVFGLAVIALRHYFPEA